MSTDGNWPFDPPKRPTYRTARGAFRRETEEELKERVGPMHYEAIQLSRWICASIASSNPYASLMDAPNKP